MPAAVSNEESSTTHLPSSLLLCEALGFAPQLLLDDIINIANNAVQDGVNGMEEFLLRWVDEREGKRKEAAQAEPPAPTKGKKGKKNINEQAEDLTQEVEQGLVSFQTLLEYHTDIAFDFFEAWSLRNIFFVPPELEQGNVVVLPHYEGSDLTGGEGGTEVVEKEREMMDEIEELRKRLDEQRSLTRLLKRGLSSADAAKQRAETRFQDVAALLGSESLSMMATLPQPFATLYDTVSSLTPLDPSIQAQPASLQEGSTLFGTGKRSWEDGPVSYANWAVSRLVDSQRINAPVGGQKDAGVKSGGAKPQNTLVDKLESVMNYVGSSNEVRGLTEALEKGRPGRNGEEGDMEVD